MAVVDRDAGRRLRRLCRCCRHRRRSPGTLDLGPFGSVKRLRRPQSAIEPCGAGDIPFGHQRTSGACFLFWAPCRDELLGNIIGDELALIGEGFLPRQRSLQSFLPLLREHFRHGAEPRLYRLRPHFRRNLAIRSGNLRRKGVELHVEFRQSRLRRRGFLPGLGRFGDPVLQSGLLLYGRIILLEQFRLRLAHGLVDVLR